jgi:hypothetical protein
LPYSQSFRVQFNVWCGPEHSGRGLTSRGIIPVEKFEPPYKDVRLHNNFFERVQGKFEIKKMVKLSKMEFELYSVVGNNAAAAEIISKAFFDVTIDIFSGSGSAGTRSL